jgi:hypothetical protein
MIKEANLCTAFFPMGTGGSRTCNARSAARLPLPRPLGALLPHELHKTLRDCAAQDSAEGVCRFQEKADQVPTPYDGVEVKLRFPISGELRFSRQGSICQPRIRWDLRSRTMIPAFGRRSSLRRPAWSSVASDIPTFAVPVESGRHYSKAHIAFTHICSPVWLPRTAKV